MGDQELETDFQAALNNGKINGAILCARSSKDEFMYNLTMGQRTLLSGEKRDHRLDDMLFVASATKLMTTIAALQCVEEGLLSLRGDLSNIAPELASKEVISGFSEDGKTPLVEPQKHPITLEMLLTHTSGLVYYFLDPIIGRWREMFLPDADSPEAKRTVEEAFVYPLAFQPGKSWMYGPGLDWAGRIVERVTGQTLTERMHSKMFNPLNIFDAQFYPVTRNDLRDRLVDLNPGDPDAVGRAVLGGSGDMNKRSKGDFGGHGLFMTAQDYLKVLHSLLANDGKIIAPRTVDDMFEDHLSPEAKEGYRAKLVGPNGAFFRVGVSKDAKAGYGLGGLLTLESVDGWYGKRTLTWGGGLTFTWFIDRENDLCGVGAVQASLPTNTGVVGKLKQVFREDIYRKYKAWKTKERVDKSKCFQDTSLRAVLA